MKRNKSLKILILAGYLGFNYNIFAQTLWLNGGLTRSKLNVVYTSKFGYIDSLFNNSVNSINGSMELEYAKRKKISMASEIGTYTASGSHAFPSATAILKVPYVYVQQLFNWYPISLKSWRIHFAIGPRIEYMSSKMKDPYDPLFFYNELKVLNKLNYGITGKMGVLYIKDRFEFKVNVTKPWKFLNFINTEPGQNLDKGNNLDLLDVTGKENVYSFNLGIGYNLKKSKK